MTRMVCEYRYFSCDFLFGAFSVDSKQRISFGGSGAVYGILLLGQGCCSFNQYNLQGRMLRLISNPALYWGGWYMRWMPYVSKSSCTHGIIISLWLICCIQRGFSISYLSIPGTVARDRCNISQIFTFFVQFQCPMLCCAFHLCNCFSGGFKMG